jgi:Saxitoxin biosynthesis operon protein SxtJ
MNIRDDIKQLKTDSRDLRKFGLMVGGVFAVLGLLFLLRHKGHWPYFLWPGVALVLFGAIIPRALKWVYVAWMSVAFVLGYVMAHVILTLFFFLVITPIGLVARLFGQDFLSLKLDRAAKSYWLPRGPKAKSPADYERQF